MTATTDEWNIAAADAGANALGRPGDQIHSAIAAVYNEVGYVQKSRTMQGPSNYKFAGEADFIEALRPSMVKHGIYAHVHRVRDVEKEVFTNKNGNVQNRVTLVATVRFTHTDGSFIESEAIGEGMDTGDKASNKAMTGALKYALRQTFCIETGTDPDDTPSSDQQRDTTPRQNTPARAPQRPTDQVAAPLIADGVLTQHGCLEFVKVFKQHGLKMSESEVVTGIAITAESYPKVIADWLTANPSMTLETLAQAVKESKGAAA